MTTGSFNAIKSCALNSHVGIKRDSNEDRGVMVLNDNGCSFFGVYDGHGGKGCS